MGVLADSVTRTEALRVIHALRLIVASLKGRIFGRASLCVRLMH